MVRLIIGLLLFSVTVHAQQDIGNQLSLDTLLNLLKQTSDAKSRLKLYGDISLLYASSQGNVEKANLYFDSTHLVALKLQSPDATADALFYEGALARYQGNSEEAMSQLAQAEKYYLQWRDSIMLKRVWHHQAVVSENIGDFENSLVLSYRLLESHQQCGDFFSASLCCMNIGNILTHLEKYEDAIAMYNKIIPLLLKCANDESTSLMETRTLMNIGNVYILTQQYNIARTYYHRAIKLSLSFGSMRTLGTCYSSLGEIYESQKVCDSALYYHKKALNLREHFHQKDKTLFSLLALGRTYLLCGDYQASIEYLQTTLAMARELKVKTKFRDACNLLADAYAATGVYQKGYAYHKLFSSMSDSILNEENSKRINELQIQYQVREKNKQIALLDKERQLQEANNAKQIFAKRMLIMGILLVALLAALSVYLIYQRLQNQRIVDSKNKELREIKFRQEMTELQVKALQAQINPHFLFNCMNSINQMILKGESEQASKYLTKFSRVVRLIVENSDAKTISLEDEMNMLKSYVALEELRCKGKIDLYINVDAAIDLQHTHLPTMLLQPFVENAIWHGLLPKKNEDRKVKISLHAKGEFLHCVIEDNGVGREKSLSIGEHSTFKKKSMGLKLIEERLQLLTGEFSEELIKIIDMKDAYQQPTGTRVELCIPID